MKTLKIIYIFLFCMIFLVSCTNKENEPSNTLAPGNVGNEYTLINGDTNKKAVSLYYPDTKSENLIRIVNEISIKRNENVNTAILRKLLRNPNKSEYSAPFKGRAMLTWISISRSVAIVNIRGDFSSLTEREMFSGIIALTNTLCELKDVEFVEILLNGKTIETSGMIHSPMTKVSLGLKNAYLQHTDMIENPDKYYDDDKEKIVLFFLDTTSNYLLCEIREVVVNNETIVQDIFKQLKNSPNFGSGMSSSLPQNVLLINEPTIIIDGDKKILNIELEAPKYETMDNKTRYMMAGSIVMSIQGALQDIDYVKILINSQPALAENLLSIDTFLDSIGELVSFYIPDNNYEYLQKINRAMDQDRYFDPKECLYKMLEFDSYNDSIPSVFPTNSTPKDILDVKVNDGCAVFNMSQNLFDEVRKSSGKRQRMFVYSIVNTLTEFDNITSVHFIVEGKIVEKFSDEIYIETPILKNTGIVYD